MSARTIITRFGGIRPMASKLGHQSHTTVQGWWDRDRISAGQQTDVLTKARELGLDVTAEDIIGISPPPEPAAEARA